MIGITHLIVKRMSGVDWLGIIVVTLIISLVVNDILCIYWKCKYGYRPKNKTENKNSEATDRTIITGFSNKNKK